MSVLYYICCDDYLETINKCKSLSCCSGCGNIGNVNTDANEKPMLYRKFGVRLKESYNKYDILFEKSLFMDYLNGKIGFTSLLSNTRFGMDPLFSISCKKRNIIIDNDHFIFLAIRNCIFIIKEGYFHYKGLKVNGITNKPYDNIDDEKDYYINKYMNEVTETFIRKRIASLVDHDIVVEFKNNRKQYMNSKDYHYDYQGKVYFENIICYLMEMSDNLLGVDGVLNKRVDYALMFNLMYDVGNWIV